MSSMPRPRLSILTFGCRVNQYESEMMRRALETEVEIVSDGADVVLLNACTVTGLAERKARQAARRLRRENPRRVIILIGCLADAVREGLTSFTEADLLAGNCWKGQIGRVVRQALSGKRGLLPQIAPPPLAEETSHGPCGRIRAFLKIQDGCARTCTFCRATQVRGGPRSKPIEAVLSEARHLVNRGYPELVLTGIDLAQYSTSEGALADVVEGLLAVPDLVRLRLASINPFGITEPLLDPFTSDDRACPHFHIPLQSGDDRILHRMARGYTVEEYLACIERVRRHLPHATFGTDLIVGFPGEDEAAIENTCRTVECVGFSNLHVFRYSERPGTAAADFAEPVPDSERRRRAEILNRRWQRSLRRLLDNRLGSTQDVLVEEHRKSGWRGYTRDYIHVQFVSESAPPIGSIRSVRITATADKHLEGIDDPRTDAN